MRLDVNDAELREAFFRRSLFDALAGLQPDAKPAWGRMTAQRDHFLEWAGRAQAERHTHLVFGPIGAEEWSRSHFKHVYHHLLQFGLA